MPNRIRFSESGPARTVYENLSEEERREVDGRLEYIRQAPFAHGDIIRQVYRLPVTFYIYDDGQWRISYGLSYRGAYFDIGVFAIARLELDLPW